MGATLVRKVAARIILQVVHMVLERGWGRIYKTWWPPVVRFILGDELVLLILFLFLSTYIHSCLGWHIVPLVLENKGCYFDFRCKDKDG